MSKTRLVLLAALAMLIVSGAVSSPSASAVECKKEANKQFVLCLGEPLVLTVGTLTLHVLENTTGKYVIKTAAITIECQKILLTKEPTITGAATSVTVNKLILHFTMCTVVAPLKCAIENGLIITLALEGNVNKKDELLIHPEEAGNIHVATISFINNGGTCLIAGRDNLVTEHGARVEGPLLSAPELERTDLKQALIFQGTVATTSLKIGTESAIIEGQFITEVLDKNNEALKWAVIEGK